MPIWAWIAIAAGIVGVIAVGVLVALLVYRSAERRALVGLVSKREAITAVGQSLEDVVVRLAEANDEDLHAFATQPDNVERHVLAETTFRSQQLATELDTQPLPGRLVPVAESLADAAYVVGEQAGKVQNDMSDVEVLDAVSSIDLERVRLAFGAARAQIQAACEACKLDDQSVYGGGLYL